MNFISGAVFIWELAEKTLHRDDEFHKRDPEVKEEYH